MLDSIIIMLTALTLVGTLVLLRIIYRVASCHGHPVSSWAVILLIGLSLSFGTALAWYFLEVWAVIPLTYASWRKLLYWILTSMAVWGALSAVLFPVKHDVQSRSP